MMVHRWLWLTLLLAPLTGLAAGTHVHGVATLQIAVDGNTLQLNLESPLDNLLGFEHMPNTAPQKALVKTMESRLRQADRLFRPNPAAHCTLKSVTLDSPVLGVSKDDGPMHDDHADLDGEFVFACAKPDELRELEVRLFDAFPGLRQLKTEAATPRGQKAGTLSPNQRRINW